MKKLSVIRIILLTLILILSLEACSSENEAKQSNLIDGNNQKEADIKAIYLTSVEGGQLSDKEFINYPEVVVVNDFEELISLSEGKEVAIWIDKDAVNLLQNNWLNESSQKNNPLVMVGFNNALYSFREIFNISSIQGPKIDWSLQDLEPGFSIWMIKEETSTSKSAFMKGYKKVPSVEGILEITNMLLEREFPEDLD